MDLYRTPTPVLTFIIPTYSYVPASCTNAGYQYSIRMVNLSALPTFISETSPGVWSITTTDRNMVGTYNLEIFSIETIITGGMTQSVEPFTLTIIKPQIRATKITP